MGMDSNPYIEVVGEGEYEERVEKHIVHLTFSITGAKNDAALEESRRYKNRGLTHLLASGMTAEEMTDGGANVGRPWFGRKQSGTEACARVIVHTEDIERLSEALRSLEHMQTGSRESFSMYMQQPVYREDEGAVAQALQSAVRMAREKASVLADEAGLALTGVIEIQELPRAKRNSGTYGDEDWTGDSDRFGLFRTAAPGTAGESSAPVLEASSRTIWLRYRVRFAVTPRDNV